MKRSLKSSSSIYEFLEPYLEAGDEADIEQARKLYWKQYKAAWRKQRRVEETEFTVSFTPKELRVIEHAATKHHRSCTKYIKESALAYSKKQFIVPDPEVLAHIRQLLTRSYTSLQNLEEGNVISTNAGEFVLQKITALEQVILETLQNAPSIEDSMRKAVASDPACKETLLQVLQTL